MGKKILSVLLALCLMPAISLSAHADVSCDIIVIGDERYEVTESGSTQLGIISAYEGEAFRVTYPDGIREVQMVAYEYNTSDDGTGASLCYSEDGVHFTWNRDKILFCDDALATLCTNGIQDEIKLYPLFKCPFHTYDENNMAISNSNDPEDEWIRHKPAPHSCGDFGNIDCRECKYCGIMEIDTPDGAKLARYHDVFVDCVPHDYAYTSNGDTHTAMCSICLHRFTEPHHYVNNVCTECGYVKYRDLDGDGQLTASDAEYLLYNVLFGDEDYPISGSVDYDGNGLCTSNDAVQLLYYILFC